MSTLVFFHAHPDDESIATAGTMVAAAGSGHRVVLVLATRGEQGEPVPGVLAKGEPLWERRVLETHRSAEILGASRVEFLGYEDSGMMGEPTNDNPSCFWRADVADAAARLAEILVEEDADVLTTYDANGGYGHPDHIQVHRVGLAAARLAGVSDVYESTMNRDALSRFLVEAPPELASAFTDEDREEIAGETFGSAEADITHAVDVTAHLERKRAAMAAHQSQIGEDAFFLTLPPDAFSAAFGTEWYIRHGAPRQAGDDFSGWLLDEAQPAGARST